MQRILIHSNYKKISVEAKKKLENLLNEEGFEVTNGSPDLILTIGGDGTMLSAIRKFRRLKVPFIGINTGSLGFLPSLCPHDLELIVKVLKEGKYRLEKYPLIKVYCTTLKNENIVGYAFNEVIIKHVAPKLMEAKVFINGKAFNYFTGDGFIISTPIGSTGYAIWAGGVATHSELKAFQITPLNPNDNSINRPMKSSMVVPVTTKVDINIVKAEKRKVIVACDGIKMSDDYISDIKIRASHEEVTILRFDTYDYFDLFRTKIIDKNMKRTF